MLDFWNDDYHKAAKGYKCWLCGGMINPGEMYHGYTGKNDGEFFNFKEHIICEKICKRYRDETGETELDDDAILEFVADEICSSCLAKDMDDCQYDGWGECVNCDRVKAKISFDEEWENRK